ncbi:MAG: thermonuclease family protein [Betaproteobacteria bacterium]|nr:thermonuclease family protein [Betaproteobacteria bacterium]
MKRLVLFLCYFSAQLSAAELHGKVVRVADGDTITVLSSNNERHKIRLLGIDAPEIKQVHGQRARQHLSDLVNGRKLTIIWQRRDKYRRIIGKPLLDGRDVGLAQIEAGHAWHYKQYQGQQLHADRAIYAASEERARAARLGLWNDPNPIPPWDFRRRYTPPVQKTRIKSR